MQQPSGSRGGLFDHTPESLAEHLRQLEEPPYRAGQVIEWVFRQRATSYDDMTNLPKPLRAMLARDVPIYRSRVVKRQDSRDGTTKLLIDWSPRPVGSDDRAAAQATGDRYTAECVLIPDGDQRVVPQRTAAGRTAVGRQTVCLSTQVGCPVGCTFCASGLDGLQRQLCSGEMVEQVMRASQLLKGDDRVSNVVFMGLGEPLANYGATLAAVRALNADWGMNIAARRITISTVGLPDQMRRLAGEGLQVTLALSLHAPTDELRRRLIPWAKRVTIASLIDAGRYYFERTGREITLEYVLLGGTNDGAEHAASLAGVARKLRCNVNLIAYNPVDGLPFRRPDDRDADRFLSALRSQGINAHLRRSRGLDIDGACGQLRRRSV